CGTLWMVGKNWIPACAGMTAAETSLCPQEELPSGKQSWAMTRTRAMPVHQKHRPALSQLMIQVDWAPSKEVTMIVLEEQILSLLKKAPAHLMSFRQLIRELDFDDSERHEIRQILHGMVKSGGVIKLKGNRFTLPEERSMISGKLSAHRDGY